MIIPIRTEAVSRQTPLANYMLIGANLIGFLLFGVGIAPEPLATLRDQHLVFQTYEPAIHQFFTYQFLHGGAMHLVGNLVFLWVFGNSVNGKMGDLPYLLFYLAGGAFAAWGYAVMQSVPHPLIGASGAIAAVTTAYLVLFPRSRVTVLLWFFLIHFFELPAMLIIGVKIIVWDNIIAPSFSGPGNVATHAHLAGYLFGFFAALGMLLVRALPRDQFDILALWKRWYRRREFASAMSDPRAKARAQYGSAAQTDQLTLKERRVEEHKLDKTSALRAQISEALTKEDPRAATELHEKLIAMDPDQCLSERDQLSVAREYYANKRFPQAASAFDRFLACYRHSAEARDIRLLLGIIYARDLRQFELADELLTQAITQLRSETRKSQCLQWLRDVRAALGRPAPET